VSHSVDDSCPVDSDTEPVPVEASSGDPSFVKVKKVKEVYSC